AALSVPEAGDALDAAIASDLDFELAKIGIDVDSAASPRRARLWLREAARQAKTLLSAQSEHVIVLSPQVFGRPGEVWYTAEQLNEVFTPQLQRAEDAIGLALRIARITEFAESAYEIARTPMDVLVQGVHGV